MSSCQIKQLFFFFLFFIVTIVSLEWKFVISKYYTNIVRCLLQTLLFILLTIVKIVFDIDFFKIGTLRHFSLPLSSSSLQRNFWMPIGKNSF
jgi:hypothetical protein